MSEKKNKSDFFFFYLFGFLWLIKHTIANKVFMSESSRKFYGSHLKNDT